MNQALTHARSARVPPAMYRSCPAALPADQRLLYLPSMIAGDCDSITDDVAAFYSGAGVPVVRDPDQDSNDLQKCLTIVQSKQDAAEQVRWGNRRGVLLGLRARVRQPTHLLLPAHRLVCSAGAS